MSRKNVHIIHTVQHKKRDTPTEHILKTTKHRQYQQHTWQCMHSKPQKSPEPHPHLPHVTSRKY
jgi:hypothetical protein